MGFERCFAEHILAKSCFPGHFDRNSGSGGVMVTALNPTLGGSTCLRSM